MSEPGAPETTSISIPARAAYVQGTLDLVEHVASDMGFEKGPVNSIRLALEEILVFVMRSALVDDPGSKIDVACERHETKLVLKVTEKGMPLDLGNLPGFTPGDDVSADGDADGLSIYLTRQAVDSMLLRNRGRDGTEIQLVKNLPSSHISNSESASESKAQASEAEQPVGKVAYDIRPFTENQALEISRCAYSTYGYSYEDFVYYPEQIVTMNRNGLLRSLVAVSADGEIMGHCALKFAQGMDGVAELGVLFVRPAYRRYGLGSALWGAAAELAKELKLSGVFCRSVTAHRASQKLAAAHSFHDCALMMSMFPHNVDLKAMGGVRSGKMSGMLQWMSVADSRRRVIFPPEHHSEMIMELYRRAGIPVETGAPGGGTAGRSAEPDIVINSVSILNIARIELRSTGSDIDALLSRIPMLVRDLCRQRIDSIYILIDIEDALAPLVSDECERAGFIFSGIGPCMLNGRDALLLQYMNTVGNPFDDLVVWTDTARRLADYIRGLYQQGLT